MVVIESFFIAEMILKATSINFILVIRRFCMKAGSMEGLIGANVNIRLSNTPMRVYRDAEHRGDTKVMKRAMQYVTDFQEKAQKYSDKAQEELKKELKEERKEQKLKHEQALERKEEVKEYVEKIQENNKLDISKTDSIEISEEGKIILKNNSQTEESTLENTNIKIYTSKGKSISTEPTIKSVDKKIDIIV